MKQLFAYIRVSTAKQGQGVSLQEQRAAIERFTSRADAEIIEWFEEKKTAAKAGRPEFARMVKLLRQGKAAGVVIHKIDRSTRNYRDWADIDELVEKGIDVHFANDDLDLRSRGGRLAADIQVVVAVDYIRNLREEARKGILGRLKQGVLPHGAPIGYLDRGAGQPKAIDPVLGPLVRQLFDLYATGSCTLRSVTLEAERLGLRTKGGKPLGLPQIHKTLRNPFFAGLIRSHRHGTFPGAHEPLVTRAIFDRVQQVLDGKFVQRTKRFTFPFRRFLHCGTCGRSLVGSERKGFVYYRCQTIQCPTTSVREDAIETAVGEILTSVALDEAEVAAIEREIGAAGQTEDALRQARTEAVRDALSAANARIARLTDLLLDGQIDAEAHYEKRTSLVAERQCLTQELTDLGSAETGFAERALKILGLAQSAKNLYKSASADRKRILLQTLVSDCKVTGKCIEFVLREPFATIARRRSPEGCGPHWYTPRTFGENRTFVEALLRLVANCPAKVVELLKDSEGKEEV
jgi:site-specific DNA recombinase